MTSQEKKYLSQFVKPIRERLLESGLKVEVNVENVIVNAQPIIRISLDSSNHHDCFAVYGLASNIYLPIPDRFKNYISVPKEDGYQAIHSAFIGPEGKVVEIRICIRDTSTGKVGSKET
jgi:GTP diphosphokinase / guanosine-3',5'-bis(diphosphate) 3'-diphosphatase